MPVEKEQTMSELSLPEISDLNTVAGRQESAPLEGELLECAP